MSAILVTLFLVALVRTILTIALAPQYLPTILKINGTLVAVLIIVFAIMRTGRINFACIVLTLFQWFTIALITYRYGGLNLSAYGFFIFVILSAGLFLGGKWALSYCAASVLYGLLLLYLEYQGLTPPIIESPLSAFNAITPSFIMTAVLVYLYSREITNASTKAQTQTTQLEVANKKLSLEISKRMQIEKQLLQSQKMEVIGTLAGGIAHDFNNILSGIFGYSQLAELNIKNPDKAKEHIINVRKSGQRAVDLVQQILTISRQTEYQKYPSEIFKIISEALGLLRSSIPTTIDINLQLSSKAKILADPTKIHQLVMNLGTNAYHAVEKIGGIINVSLTDIKMDQPYNLQNQKIPIGNYIKLEVSDDGHGMDEATLEKIFDPYFTTKETGKGTGLGLAIVQAIVEEHEGFWEVFSTLNKGTKFCIYLPVIISEIIPQAPTMEKELSLSGNERIMIVDDEKPIREIYKELLENYGYTTRCFKTGKDAYKEFKNNPDQFDLIITDMTMPGMTGDRLVIKLLKIRPDLPIILCSGFSEAFSEKNALEIGVKKYVLKPIENQDLLSLIRDTLKNN